MSEINKNEILIDKFGTDAPNLSRFDRGGTSLAEVQESLRNRGLVDRPVAMVAHLAWRYPRSTKAAD